jgi:hypothetical protein
MSTIENLKLMSSIKPFTFFRVDGFYILEIPEDTLEDNIRCNPGTIRVENAITGEIVWNAKL